MLQGVFLKSHFCVRVPLKISDLSADKIISAFVMESEIKATLSFFLSLVAAAMPGELRAGLARAGCRTRKGPTTSPPSPGWRGRHRSLGEVTRQSPRVQGTFWVKSRDRRPRCLRSSTKLRAHKCLHKTQASRLNLIICQRLRTLRFKKVFPLYFS